MSAIRFKLDQSKILMSGNGLNLNAEEKEKMHLKGTVLQFISIIFVSFWNLQTDKSSVFMGKDYP